MSTSFRDPYEADRKARPQEVVKVGLKLPKHAHEAVKRCRIQEGTLQITGNILWDKLVRELNKRNITSYVDSDRFEQFVNECQLVLPGESIHASASGGSGSIIEPDRGGSASGSVDGRSSPPNDRRTTARPGRSVESTSDVGADTQGQPRGRGRGRGAKKGAKTNE